MQNELVERFLDLYLPQAEVAVQEGLTPVFPPLEPGGDYWDLAFLRSAFQSLQRRGATRLLEELVIGAYAWAGNLPLDWGAGGPERWPGARPYMSLPGVQDQRGFHIFDWYLAISQAELGKSLPIILLRAGCCPGDQTDPVSEAIDDTAHAQRNLVLARRLAGDANEGNPIPAEVLACNFWLLAADEDSSQVAKAWYRSGSGALPVVDAFRRWTAERKTPKPSLPVPPASPSEDKVDKGMELKGNKHPISHYLLLPLYAWGVAEWSLELIQPLLQQSCPTVGFSLEEALLAERVTVVGQASGISEEALEMLRQGGCQVERLLEDGTLVAT